MQGLTRHALRSVRAAAASGAAPGMFLSLPDFEVEPSSSPSTKLQALRNTSPMFRSHSSAGSSDDEDLSWSPRARAHAPRCCNFSRRLELDFAGNVLPAAVCLGDLDNDGTNELVVGSMAGDLAVFKGISSSAPWLRADGLGAISCCAVGEGLLWPGLSSLAVVTAEGWLHLFHIYPDWRGTLPAAQGAAGAQRRFAPLRRGSGAPLRPVHTARVPLNGCTLLLRPRRHVTPRSASSGGSTPTSGGCELYLGSTDGTVYCLLLTNAGGARTPALSLSLRITTEWSVVFPLRSLFLQPKPPPPAHFLRSGSGGGATEQEPELELCCCVQSRVGGYFRLDPALPDPSGGSMRSPDAATTAGGGGGVNAPIGAVIAIPLIPPMGGSQGEDEDEEGDEDEDGDGEGRGATRLTAALETWVGGSVITVGGSGGCASMTALASLQGSVAVVVGGRSTAQPARRSPTASREGTREGTPRAGDASGGVTPPGSLRDRVASGTPRPAMLANTPRPNAQQWELGQTQSKPHSPLLGPSAASSGSSGSSAKARRQASAAAKAQSGELMWRHALGVEFCAVGLLDLEGIDIANENDGKTAAPDADVAKEQELESGVQVVISLADVREQRRAAAAALADQVVVSPGAAGGTPALGAATSGKMVVPLSLDDSADSVDDSNGDPNAPQTPLNVGGWSLPVLPGSGSRPASDAGPYRQQAAGKYTSNLHRNLIPRDVVERLFAVTVQQRLPTLVACAHDGSTVFISPSGEELWCTAGRPVVACLTGAIGVGAPRGGDYISNLTTP